MQNERQKLNKVLGRTEVFALAFGTMIGWGWVIMSAVWINAAGVLGAALCFLLAGTMCIFVGLTYAELTSALPLAGGEVGFSYRSMGYFGSWITGWTISFAYIGVAAWEGIALSTAFDYLIPLPKIAYLWTVAGNDVYLSWSAVGMIGAVILTILNLRGVRLAAVFQILLVIMMLMAGMVAILGGAAFGSTDNIAPLFTNFNGIGMVLLTAPSMFIGFDIISKSAEEISTPLKHITSVLIVSVTMAMFWYILMIAATSLSAPPGARSIFTVPTADSAAYVYESAVFGKIIILGGICGIITSWNGFIVGASRTIFAMGRAKMLPNVFGKVDSKTQAPSAAILLVGSICCLSPLLGEKALFWLVDASSFATVLAYLLVSASFLILRRKEPELQRPFTLKNGKWIGTAAIVAALFFFYWYTPLSPNSLIWPYEWGLIFSWIGIGAILVVISKVLGDKKGVSVQERELLIFGEEYAREL